MSLSLPYYFNGCKLLLTDAGSEDKGVCAPFGRVKGLEDLGEGLHPVDLWSDLVHSVALSEPVRSPAQE